MLKQEAIQKIMMLKQEAIHAGGNSKDKDAKAGGNSKPPFKNEGNSLNRIGIISIYLEAIQILHIKM